MRQTEAGRRGRPALLGAAILAVAGVVAVSLALTGGDDDDPEALAPASSAAATTAPEPPPPTTSSTTTLPAPPTTRGPQPGPGAPRDPVLWPFTFDSPWNTPIGSGAQFAPADDPVTADVIASGAEINAQYYSHPVYVASLDDPVRTVVDRHDGETISFHVPDEAVPALGTDAHLHVISPDGAWVDELWTAQRDGDLNLVVGHHARVSLRGPGTDTDGARAYGGSAIAGLIRRWELEAGEIRHALAFAIPGERMRVGPVWPAVIQDGDTRTYAGNVPMGTLVAIPPDVDIEALGLTPSGLVLARALQDFGAYLVDSGGNFALYAEPTAENMPELRDMRRDVDALQDLLRPVTNNGPSSVGGGGRPRTPRAPSLQAPASGAEGALSR